MSTGYLPDLVLQVDEIAEVRFVAEDDIGSITVDRLSRCLHLAAGAARVGETYCAEMGYAAARPVEGH
jgi:hypothetical protein